MERQIYEAVPEKIVCSGELPRSPGQRCAGSELTHRTTPFGETISYPGSRLVSVSDDEMRTISQLAHGGAHNVQDIYPLTPAQEGILFQVQAISGRQDPYVVRIVFSISSESVIPTFTAALQEVIDRYDALRTTIMWRGLSRPLQVVHRTVALPVVTIALENGPDPNQWISQFLESQAQRLDVGTSPLIRAHVISSSNHAHRCVLLEIHHIICDAQSLYCIFAEVIACMEGRASQLPRPIPFRDYVELTLTEESPSARTFFGKKLRGITSSTAPFGVVEVNNDGTNVQETRDELEPSFAKKLNALATSMKVFRGALVHAACALVVAHTSERSDIVLGTVMLGRLHASADPQRTQGMFINTLPLRVHLQPLSCRQLVTQIQRELMELLAYEHASLALARHGSGIQGSEPLFTVLVNYRCSRVDWAAEWARIGITQRFLPQRTNYPITLTIDDTATGFHLAAETDRQIDSRRVVCHLRLALVSLLQALDYAPDLPALRLSSRLEAGAR